jgi:alkylation response protein AidB-like acyl-CoA dehydrogenase
MDLTLTEDQELIQGTARELLEARAASAGARAMRDDPAGYSAALWKEMVELGWMGLAVPEAYGGVGAGFLEVCLLVEEMGRFLVPSPFLPTVVCCALPIAQFGDERQRSEWLGAIARGRIMTPVPGRWDRSGADPGGGPEGQGGGSEIVANEAAAGGVELTGAAMFVPYAHVADDLLVVARRADTLAVFLVDAAAPGIGREPLAVIGADRPYRVTFDGVPVAGDRLLAGGPAVADAIVAHGTAATCAELVGAAQRVLDMTVEYATQREQFGKPIGGFQAVQHHCADMATDVLTSRFIAYEAIWRLSAGLDATTEVSMAKAWVSEAAQRVCARGHQVHGAIGFTREHDLHLFAQHVMGAATTFGDGDHHWERLTRRLGLSPS